MKQIALLAFAALLLALSGCARQQLLPALGMEVPVQRDFPAGFQVPISHETGKPVTGFGGGGGGVHRTPIILVHGNTVAPRFWNSTRAWLLAHGYTKDEIWAVGYGHDCTCHFDSNDASVPTIEAFVSAVQTYLGKLSGHPVPQVDIIAHSLGVTLVRQWMKQDNAWHRVRHFIGVAGANHGTWIAPPDAHGISRAGPLELTVGSAWLAQLNRGGETPGATRYLMLFDGTGWYDAFYDVAGKDSPALKGATNMSWDVKHKWAGLGHLELPRSPETLAYMLDFIQQSGGSATATSAPSIEQDGANLRSEPATAQLHCSTDGYPDWHTPAVSTLSMQAGQLYTCFASNPASQLSSPMARLTYPAGATAGTALQMTASPNGGSFHQPQLVKLAVDDPSAWIVYTTSGTQPDIGSPLYKGPIYMASSVTLNAVAISPDGRRSAPLHIEYSITPP